MRLLLRGCGVFQSLKGLLKIGRDIFDRLNADRNANYLRTSTSCLQLLFSELAVCR